LEGKEEEVKFGSWKICAICALVLSAAFVCQADIIYGFSIFNDDGWAKDKRPNFTVAVSDEGKNEVCFVFQNSSYDLKDSSITAVYFDDKSLFKSTGDIAGSLGVSFSKGANPQSLPGGENLDPAFPKKPFFAADADSGKPKTSNEASNGKTGNGINPGEWLKITFNLNPGVNFDSVIKQIDAGGCRFGIHIQSLPNGDSVSAINHIAPNPPVIPEPTTIALLSLGGLSLIRRKKH